MAFISNAALRAHSCPVCRGQARVPCDGCDEVFYCTVGHRDSDHIHRLYDIVCTILKGRVRACAGERKAEAASTSQATNGVFVERKFQTAGTYTSERSKSAPSPAAARILVNNIDLFRSKFMLGFNQKFPFDEDFGYFRIFMNRRTGELVGLETAPTYSNNAVSRKCTCFVTGEEGASETWRVDRSQLESSGVMISVENGMMKKLLLRWEESSRIDSFIEEYNCVASFVAADLAQSSKWDICLFCDRMANVQRYPSRMAYRWGSVFNALILFLALAIINKGYTQFNTQSH